MGLQCWGQLRPEFGAWAGGPTYQASVDQDPNRVALVALVVCAGENEWGQQSDANKPGASCHRCSLREHVPTWHAKQPITSLHGVQHT
jgi:hypothetical protein